MTEDVARASDRALGPLTAVVRRVPLAALVGGPLVAIAVGVAIDDGFIVHYGLQIAAPRGAELVVGLLAVAGYQAPRFAVGPRGTGRAVGLLAESVGAGMVLATRAVGEPLPVPLPAIHTTGVDIRLDGSDILLGYWHPAVGIRRFELSAVWLLLAVALLVGGALVTQLFARR